MHVASAGAAAVAALGRSSTLENLLAVAQLGRRLLREGQRGLSYRVLCS